LAKLDGESWRIYNRQNSGLPHDLILSFALDGNTKWIGTWGGLAQFDGANWTAYDTSNSGLPDDWVFAVAVDGSGNTWSGTWLGGLAAYREGGVIIDPVVGHVRRGTVGRVRP
jgi:ligand-binding sensor domain-containing protein